MLIPEQQATANGPENVPVSVAGKRDVRLEILRAIVAASQPAPLPPAWGFLSRCPEVRQLTTWGEALLSSLRSSFLESDLQGARVILQRGGQFCLNHVIQRPDERILIEYDGAEQPCNFVSAHGQLVSARPPLMDVLPWANGRGQFPAHAWLFVLSTGEDLHVVHRLGFAATTSAGLMTVSETNMEAIFGTPKEPRSLGRNRLIIPFCQLAERTFHPRPETVQLIRQLIRISDIHRTKPEALFCLWVPSKIDFAKVCDAVRLRSTKLICHTISDSVHNSLESPADWGEVIHRALMCSETWKLNELRHHLEGCSVVPGNPRTRRALRLATERYSHALRRRVVEKFFDAIDATDDPVESALLLLGADVAEQLVQRHQLLQKAREGLANRHTSLEPNIVGPDDVRLLQQLANCLFKLQKM